MDCFDIRREKLELLIAKKGNIDQLAKSIKKSPAQISHIRNEVRNMGERMAREIEEKLRLPQGWMDNQQDFFVSDRMSSLAHGHHPNERRVPIVPASELTPEFIKISHAHSNYDTVVVKKEVPLGTFATEIFDNSMAPDLNLDDLVVFIQDCDKLKPENIVIACDNEGNAFVRNYYDLGDGDFELAPSNPAWPKITSKKSKITLLGKCIMNIPALVDFRLKR